MIRHSRLLSLLICTLVICTAILVLAENTDTNKNDNNDNHRNFCVIGGGPSGIQTAYFFKRFGISRDQYVVFERSSGPGSFFDFYPRQRNLISINKVHTGSNDTEFNLRHDWNSLLNHEKYDNRHDPHQYYPSCTEDTENNEEGEEVEALKDPLLFSEISKKYYPKADTIPAYLHKFVQKYKLNIQYDTEVVSVRRDKKNEGPFHLELSSASSNNRKNNKKSTSTFTCNAIIVASGKSVERSFQLKEGTDLLTPYSEAPQDPEEYTNQEILILGAGNAAFEVARALESHTALVHIASRHPIQLAHQTHYVGDVRAVNLGFLDRYQLKSMDVLMTLTSTDIREGRLYRDENTGKICLRQSSKEEEKIAMREMEKAGKSDEEVAMMEEENFNLDKSEDTEMDEEEHERRHQHQRQNKLTPEERAQLKVEYEASMEIFPSRHCYHRVISCLGFRYNSSIFAGAPPMKNTNNNIKKIPLVKPMSDSTDSFLEVTSNFESVNVPDLFVAGALAHFRDFKRSAGGFIHGFRYTARTLVGMLRERYQKKLAAKTSCLKKKNNFNYPFIKFTKKEEILKRFMWRLKNVSSLYQMQSQLSDVVLIVSDEEYHYYQDLPLDMIKSRTPELVSIDAFKNPSLRYLSLSLEFGKDFQGVGVLHHQAQKETYKRQAERMLWDHASPTADPDFRLHQNRAFGQDQPLRKLIKITAKDLMERDSASSSTTSGNQLNQQQQSAGGGHMPAAPHKTTLLNPLQEPPSMVPGKNGRPPKLNRFLFLHPVVREWKRSDLSPPKKTDDNEENAVDEGVNKKIKTVKNKLIREVRLHEDVLNDFTGKHHHETPVKNFLEKALQ